MKHYYQEGMQEAPKLARLPRKESRIWRFMSLSKFLDLITRRALFLSQVAVLQKNDPYEGSLALERLEYLSRVMSDDDFARQELHILPGRPIPEELRAAFDPRKTAWQNERSAERTFVNCWHLSPVESANLWAVYTAQGEGVAIQSTVGALCDAIDRGAEHLKIAPVRYVDHQTFKMGPFIEDAVFYKRLSFKSERELRIRVLLPLEKCITTVEDRKIWRPPTGIYLPVNCNKLIENVYISPTLGDWFRVSVERILDALRLNKPVVGSSIKDPRIL